MSDDQQAARERLLWRICLLPLSLSGGEGQGEGEIDEDLGRGE